MGLHFSEMSGKNNTKFGKDVDNLSALPMFFYTRCSTFRNKGDSKATVVEN